jgi:hypothetical protein
MRDARATMLWFDLGKWFAIGFAALVAGHILAAASLFF